MTQITLGTDIPSNINSLERLAMWAIIALKRVNPTTSRAIIPNENSQDMIETAVFQGADNKYYFSGTVLIELPPDYPDDNTVKLWQKAIDIDDVQLPEALKQN